MKASPMSIIIPTFNQPDSDFENLLQQCSNKIGQGSSRDVFEIPTLEHSDKVLKVIKLKSSAANWCEIVLYIKLVEECKPYFARIHSWSLSGKFLVMERALRHSPWNSTSHTPHQ